RSRSRSPCGRSWRPGERPGRSLHEHRLGPHPKDGARVTSVLVVDDEAAILRAVGAGLEARGYEVRRAATGQAAIDAVTLESPELVVLDLGLPDIDGVEVCRRIRAWSAVPIIVLSAAGAEDRNVGA